MAGDPYAAIADPANTANDPYAAIADPVQADTSAAAPAPLPGFTDPQKQQILDYLPKAKDAADLQRFSLEVSGGRSQIGNPQDVLDNFRKGVPLAWTPAVADPNLKPNAPAPQSKFDQFRDIVGDAIFNAADSVIPGLGQSLRAARDNGSGKAYTEHVANALGLDYGPEIGGFIHTLVSPGEYGDFGANLDRNVADERAILTGDSQGHGLASAAGELTGVALPALAGDEAGLANLSRGGKLALATGEGAAYGSGAAGPGDRLAGAVTGAALGAGTDLALPALKTALVGTRAGTAADQAFAAAADRQGVDYMAADLPSAPKSKFATALVNLTIGAIPLMKQGAKNVASAAAAASRVAGDVGTVADATGAGQAAQKGAQQFIDSSQSTLDSLESKIPIAASAPAVVSNTRAALNQFVQSFRSNPKLAALLQDPKIASYLDALTPQTTQEATGLFDASGQPIMRDVTHGGGLSWQDLRDFRSYVGNIIGQPGIGSDGAQIGQLRSLYGALSDDIRATAQSQGSSALNAWTRWNNYARARANRIDNVVSLILGNDGNKAPQTAFEALQRLGAQKGGDPIKLAQALRSMPDDEANSVRATIIDGLGDANPGAQNAQGDVFSPAQFVTNWNRISDRAKSVLFTGAHRQALDDLATIFSGMKSSTKFANTSKTGISVIAGANAGALFAHPVLGPMAIALQYAGGKLLASPAFARKLAATPMNEAGARAFWSRPWVNSLAAKNPAIAAEIRAFQSAFLTGINDNTASSLAAQPQSQEQDQSAQAQ